MQVIRMHPSKTTVSVSWAPANLVQAWVRESSKGIMKLLYTSLACAAVASASAQSPTSTDVWDVSSGSVITGSSGLNPVAGGVGALLGENGQDIGDLATWMFFADVVAPSYVHFVEWETPADVTVGQVRVFAYGDNWNLFGREFEQFVLKFKSPGSTTYDVTALTVAPPLFDFLDDNTALVIDEAITPIIGRAFRAEFLTASSYGPHIVELDALSVPAPPPPPPRDVPTSATDVWDVTQGAVVTASSDIHPAVGSAGAMFGENGQFNTDGSAWTFFADGQPEAFVHFVEWETPADVTIAGIRVFAFGDADLNNGREFAELRIKAKSTGSSDYDLTLLTFVPSHPYAFIDPLSWLIMEQTITPVTARYFRAEFVQYSGNPGFDGPRIVEIDAITGEAPPPPPPPPVLPVIVGQPENVVGNIYMPVALSVEATGTGTVRYQWFKDGTALDGQTGAALMIPSLIASDVAAYHVTVTDDVGTVTSAAAAVSLDYVNMVPADFDLWDVRTGAAPGAHSDLAAGSALEGMFGGDVTEFANQPAGTVQFVEWSIPAPAVVRTVRLFASGDGLNAANLHEFGSFTLKAKSVGSSTFDIVVGTFTPTHPYPLLDAGTFAILDTDIAPITAAAFRAEFTTLNGGPRVLELDAFGTRPLVMPGIVIAPRSQVVQRNASVTLNVLAKGGNLQYQWKFKGLPIAGATGGSLTIPKMQKNDEGNYSVVVSNELGSVESVAATLSIASKH